MAAGGAILKKKIKKKKLRIDLKWREMRSKVIFGHPKWPPVAILQTKFRVPTDREKQGKQGKWPKKIPCREKSGNLKI